MLDADRATLYVVDQGRNEIWSRVLTEGEVPEAAAPVPEIRLPLDGRSLAAEVARRGHVLRIDDPYDDPRFDPSVDARTGYRTRSILVVPIESRDRRRIGVLQAVNHHDGPFRAEDERYAQALATEADIALEYVQLSGDLAVERLRVVKVAEEERHRLARDLHDGVAQTPANAALGIELAHQRDEWLERRRAPDRREAPARAGGRGGRLHRHPRGGKQRDQDRPRAARLARRLRRRRRGRRARRGRRPRLRRRVDARDLRGPRQPRSPADARVGPPHRRSSLLQLVPGSGDARPPPDPGAMMQQPDAGETAPEA